LKSGNGCSDGDNAIKIVTNITIVITTVIIVDTFSFFSVNEPSLLAVLHVTSSHSAECGTNCVIKDGVIRPRILMTFSRETVLDRFFLDSSFYICFTPTHHKTFQSSLAPFH